MNTHLNHLTFYGGSLSVWPEAEDTLAINTKKENPDQR